MEDRSLVEVARKRRSHAPPPPVVWEALNDPWAEPRRPWLDQLRDTEQPPVVLSSNRPSGVVWATLWPQHPHLEVRFSIEPAEGGSMLRTSLWAPTGDLNADEAGRLRHRISYLINDSSGLRGSFGQ
jgi:hypothetical protein